MTIYFFRHFGKLNTKPSRRDRLNAESKSSNVGHDLYKDCAFDSGSKNSMQTEKNSLQGMSRLRVRMLKS